MIRRTSTILFVSLLIVAVLTMTAFGALKQGKASMHKPVGDKIAERALAYALSDDDPNPHGMGGNVTINPGKVPIGTVTAAGSGLSPGVVFGNTVYDYQHNGSMGRMIGTGPHTGETGPTIVHFSWMYMPDKQSDGIYRTYAYSAYRSVDHSQLPPVYLLTEGEDYGGFVNVDVTSDNRAIVGGHNNQLLNLEESYLPELHYDGGPAYATFPNVERMPDTVALYSIQTTDKICWPHFFFQFGSDTVMHVAAQPSEPGTDPQSVVYYRKVGFEGSPATQWDYPPYVVDTVQGISQDVVGQRNGDRVCLVWFANLPYQEPWCDTCSGLTIYEGALIGQKDNDIYYQESYTQGATWEPRVNMTKAPIGGKAYKAYCDASVLYDSEDNLHITWNAIPWAADLCIDDGGYCWADTWNQFMSVRLMHWSENVPYIRPIADQTYDPLTLADSCYPNDWSIRIAKMSLAECDGNLYCIWTQFNNPKQGIIDDCAEWGYEASPVGENAANGELWVSVSEDWGMTWDYQRNLTNTYTPRCDPKFGEDCQHDYWASMNYMGRQVDPSEDWIGATIVDPSGGSYTGDYYLDVQYMADLDAGSIVRGYGSWTDNPMKWFRMPCVDPIPLPIFVSNWSAFGDPGYCKPGESLDTTLMLENVGNTELTYTLGIVYDDGSSGWLGVSDFSGSIPSGLAGTENGVVTINQNLMTAYGNYFAHLHFEGNDPNNLPCDIPIELIIADTIVRPTWDSVKTSCLGMIAGNNANYGRGGFGKVNMDYYSAGDCDTTATAYMWEGTPLIGWLDGDDTVFAQSIWSADYLGDGFRPQGGEWAARVCPSLDADVYHIGTVTTQDSTIGLTRVFVAPQSGDCNFILQYTKVWSYDGAAHDGLVIGEGIDWDIPADFPITDTSENVTAANTGGIDPSRNLVYCQGYEAYGLGSDTTYPFNCQDNDDRFGGNAMIESYLNGSLRSSVVYSGFAEMNDSLQGTGYFPSQLYQRMASSGLRTTDSLNDLNTVLTYEFDFDLGATDVYEVVSVLAAVHEGELVDLQATVDAAETWYNANGGLAIFADGDANGQIDVCAGCCAVMGKFYNDGEPFSILDIDNFIEWLLRGTGADIYDCLEQVDVTSASSPGDPDGSADILDIDYMIGHLLRQTIPSLGECP